MKSNLQDSGDLETSLNSKPEYQVYSYRYVVSVIYALSAIMNSIMWVCTSPIITNLESIYGLNLFVVNLGTSLIYLMLYPPMSFVSNYIIDVMGLRTGILIGNFLTIVGLWVRTFSQDGFYFIFAGQTLGGIAAPCILNAPQKLSAVWYPPEQRALSTTLLSIASPLGVGIGFFTSRWFVDNNGFGSVGLIQVHHLMMFTAILGSVLLAPSFILLKEKPPTPPSKAAAKEKYSYKDSLKSLAQNKNYILFFFSTGMMWGTFNILATVLAPLIAPFGYSSADAGMFGGLTLAMGMLGSPGWGIYVGKTKKYKQSLIILGTVSTILLTAQIIVGPLGHAVPTGILIALYGFFTTPMLPIIFELCVEISFPVAEANAGGLMYMGTQLFGVIGSFILDTLLASGERSGAIKAFIVLIGLQTFGLIGFIATKENLLRTKYEKETTGNVEDAKKEMF